MYTIEVYFYHRIWVCITIQIKNYIEKYRENLYENIKDYVEQIMLFFNPNKHQIKRICALSYMGHQSGRGVLAADNYNYCKEKGLKLLSLLIAWLYVWPRMFLNISEKLFSN